MASNQASQNGFNGQVPNKDIDKAYTIAIVGGGIGGLICAIGLLKHPHIDVQIYEAASAFSEIGAGVAIGPNAQRALRMMGQNTEAAFDNCRTPNLWASHADEFLEYRVGYGLDTETVIAAPKNSAGMQSVHRAHFLDELVKLVPPECCHFGKALVTFTDKGVIGGVDLHFKDGSIAHADALIGADGIKSQVRLNLLGEDHAAARPQYAGAVVYRALVSMESALQKISKESAQNSMMRIGPGKIILTYPIDHGVSMNAALIDLNQPHWVDDAWVKPAEHEKVAKNVESWSVESRAIVELMKNPLLSAWSMWDAPPAPFYNKGRVTVMGDAAHSSTPFLGQGASQAIEDALVLETLLGRTQMKQHIPKAFAAYDQVRRHRTQEMVTSSRETGKLMSWQLPGVGSDLGRIKEKMITRMNWMWDVDLQAQNEHAVAVFEKCQ